MAAGAAKTRRFHRILGILLVLPFIGWAITGFFFFIKPGYKDAYELLKPKALPLTELPHIQGDSQWLEFRLVRTVLGLHLLVKTGEGPRHLDPLTGEPRPFPQEKAFRLLLEDAIAAHPERYGAILRVEENRAFTDTGVEITMNWDNLSFYQYGGDTRFIDRMYSIHYLRWTGSPSVDKVLGAAGLAMILLMTASGLILLVKSKR